MHESFQRPSVKDPGLIALRRAGIHYSCCYYYYYYYYYYWSGRAMADDYRWLHQPTVWVLASGTPSC